MHRPDLSRLYASRYPRIVDSISKSPFMRRHYQAALTAALPSLLHPQATVVDIGCNTGRFLSRIRCLNPTARLIGTDINPQALNSAARRGLRVHHASAENLRLPSSSTDIIFALHVLEHLPHPSRCLSQIHRLLKPSGRAVIIVPPNLYGLETLRVAHHHLLPSQTGWLAALRHARRLHCSPFGHPLGGAAHRLRRLLSSHRIPLSVSGGLRLDLFLSSLLILHKLPPS